MGISSSTYYGQTPWSMSFTPFSKYAVTRAPQMSLYTGDVDFNYGGISNSPLPSLRPYADYISPVEISYVAGPFVTALARYKALVVHLEPQYFVLIQNLASETDPVLFASLRVRGKKFKSDNHTALGYVLSVKIPTRFVGTHTVSVYRNYYDLKSANNDDGKPDFRTITNTTLILSGKADKFIKSANDNRPDLTTLTIIDNPLETKHFTDMPQLVLFYTSGDSLYN